jgi:RecA/RadA recombinase
MALDAALGVGGLARGRVTEIFGPESSGKTTLALHVIAAAQKAGGQATFIDAEHALDPVYAAKLGVDTENLFVNQPDTGEQALEIADALVKRCVPCANCVMQVRSFRAAHERSSQWHHGRDRCGLGGGASAQGGARGRHGAVARRRPGASDEPGTNNELDILFCSIHHY